MIGESIEKLNVIFAENRFKVDVKLRNTKRMFRKVFCKYYPNCMDEEECLYEHEKDPKEDESNG